MCVAARNCEKCTKNPYFRFQGRSRSSMLVLPERSWAVLVMIHSQSMSICNHSRATFVDSSRNRAFWRGYPNLTLSYGGLLEPRGRNLHCTLLESTFNAENFACRLSWSIVSDFGAIHSWNVCRGLKLRKKITKTHYFGGSWSFKVIDVGTRGKLSSSACYDKPQYMCQSAIVLTLDELISVK